MIEKRDELLRGIVGVCEDVGVEKAALLREHSSAPCSACGHVPGVLSETLTSEVQE
jgi:hypothetical protein